MLGAFLIGLILGYLISHFISSQIVVSFKKEIKILHEIKKIDKEIIEIKNRRIENLKDWLTKTYAIFGEEIDWSEIDE